MFDLEDNFMTMIENDKPIILKSKVLFHKDVKDPIFTMTLKDFKGLEICGTNTVIEKIITGEFKKGDIAIKELRKHMSWYTKNMKNSSEFRNYINTIEDKNLLIKKLEEFFLD